MPLREMTFRSVRSAALGRCEVAMIARRAPTPADGSVERIVIGWMRLS